MLSNTQSILLISSDERHRSLLDDALHHMGISIHTVADLVEARTYLSTRGGTIIVMPYMGATIELLRFLENTRESDRGDQVLLLCLEKDLGLMHQFVEMGAFDYISKSQGPDRIITSIRNAQRSIDLSSRLEELNAIGVALSKEHDRDNLLELILKSCRELTHSDAGSLYLKLNPDSTIPGSTPQLLFKVAQNHSLDIPYKEFKMPLNSKSLAGYTAVTGDVNNIADCYRIPEGSEFHFDDKWDKMVGYRTTSMLVVPMRDHNDQILGVIQLINRKRHLNDILTPENCLSKVIPYEKEYEDIALSVASQAGLSLENTQLLSDLEQTFYGFVNSSAQSIEARDKTTAGHSDRIKAYVLSIASRINEVKTGPYADVTFEAIQMKEMEYAAILHDIGKIGVSETVLLKSHRLTPPQLDVIRYRFNYFKACLREKTFRGYLNKISSGNMDFLTSEADSMRVELDEVLSSRIKTIDDNLAFIVNINSLGWLSDENLAKLDEIRGQILLDIDDVEKPFITDEEYLNLSIRRGNLTSDEREQINQHVVHTYNILSKIPWGKTGLDHVALIAGSHHERNDGSGYPNHLTKEEIPLQARILAVADVYEALTATDRPYKPAMPVAKALSILEEEASKNKLDPDVVRMFIDDGLFKEVVIESKQEA
jgi:HD-GYP domain-containing protein (c-di-GMP phosphodiesterase class II)